jgi:tetratricopeptide (TPR) repeat protein/TolB-like protein
VKTAQWDESGGATAQGRNAYNQAVVHTLSRSRLLRVLRVAARAGLGLALGTVMLLLLGARPAFGQADADASAPAEGRSRILLVLPFDNRSGQPSIEWVREAAPEILGSRFLSAGFAPMSRADWLYALDHLGLPQGFHPSRATALKLAQTLDADSIVVGGFTTEGTSILVEAQVVDVPRLRMSDAVSARGQLRDLIAVLDSLAWRLTRQLNPGFSGSEETFVAAGGGLRVDAFEQYIRGITEPDQAERLRHLKQAVTLNPEYGEAWMALGREDFNGQQYEEAASAFAKVGSGNPDALEAGFYRGLSLLFSGDYPGAERAFAGIAQVLPLPQVLNNEGVADSRQGHDGIALFRQAETADPNAADYHFNLALSLKRHGNAADAMAELAQCLRLRPNDSEALALQEEWKEPAKLTTSGPEAASPDAVKADPLERIARSFDAAAFRQAALMLDQMNGARQAALTPDKRAAELATQAKDYLDRGLLLEAERLYHSAVAADSKSAVAHAGLAEVRERTGDADGARKEAEAALELQPLADAYVVLGQLDLSGGKLEDAAREAGEALGLEPANRSAHELRSQIEARGGRIQ